MLTTLLPNGKVLMVGGLSGDPIAPQPSTLAFVLDPSPGLRNKSV